MIFPSCHHTFHIVARTNLVKGSFSLEGKKKTLQKKWVIVKFRLTSWPLEGTLLVAGLQVLNYCFQTYKAVLQKPEHNNEALHLKPYQLQKKGCSPLPPNLLIVAAWYLPCEEWSLFCSCCPENIAMKTCYCITTSWNFLPLLLNCKLRF